MSGLEKRFPVYSLLLRLYPPAYRRQYGEQMLQTLADMLDAKRSRTQRTLIWLRTAFDLPASLLAQQTAYAGSALTHETPDFVRRNALVSILFFAPFFIIAAANDLAAHRLYNTWFWDYHVLLTWIVILPALGLLLSAVTLAAWARRLHGAWWRELCNVYRSWIILLPLLLGTGILLLVFFHDSVHCVAGNPIRELQAFQSTLRCVEQW